MVNKSYDCKVWGGGKAFCSPVSQSLMSLCPWTVNSQVLLSLIPSLGRTGGLEGAGAEYSLPHVEGWRELEVDVFLFLGQLDSFKIPIS